MFVARQKAIWSTLVRSSFAAFILGSSQQHTSRLLPRAMAGHGWSDRYQLFIAATHGVFALTDGGLVELFKSGSNGIAGATRTDPESGIIAIADSHIVLLHNVTKGMQRTYRLKGLGPPRELKYDKRSQLLLYTTALEPAVQLYSIGQQRFLEPAASHPSPPTVFAVHAFSQLSILLSASEKPSTILITTLEGASGRAKSVVQPPCTESACSAAAFHPFTGPGPGTVLFVLGFVDGTIAAYSFNLKNVPSLAVSSGSPWEELAFMQKAHVTTNDLVQRDAPQTRSPMRNAAPDEEIHTDSDHLNESPSLATAVTAIALLPGHICMAVSIGSDGQCCITDFEPQGGPVVTRRWTTNGSSRCLAVTRDCIAIGQATGEVSLYDLRGTMIFLHTFKGHSIIDLEWMENIDLQPTEGARYKGNSREPATSRADTSTKQKTGIHMDRSDLSLLKERGYSLKTPQKAQPKVQQPSERHRSRSPQPHKLSKASSQTEQNGKLPGKEEAQGSAISKHERGLSESPSDALTEAVKDLSPDYDSAPVTSVRLRVTSPDDFNISTKKSVKIRNFSRGHPRRIRVQRSRSSKQMVQDVEDPALLNMDGNDDNKIHKHRRNSGFLNKQADHLRTSSISSSTYSDDYVIEWSRSPTAKHNPANLSSRRALSDELARFPFRPPDDANDEEPGVHSMDRSSQPRYSAGINTTTSKPTLKVDPIKARKSLKAKPIDHPSKYPTVAPTVQSPMGPKHIPVDCKDARKGQSFQSSTDLQMPTKIRKASSVEIDLLSTAKPPKKPARPISVSTAAPSSSGATGSYVTARTQTDDLTESAHVNRLRDINIELEHHTRDFKQRLNDLVDEFQEGLFRAVSNIRQ